MRHIGGGTGNILSLSLLRKKDWQLSSPTLKDWVTVQVHWVHNRIHNLAFFFFFFLEVCGSAIAHLKKKSSANNILRVSSAHKLKYSSLYLVRFHWRQSYFPFWGESSLQETPAIDPVVPLSAPDILQRTSSHHTHFTMENIVGQNRSSESYFDVRGLEEETSLLAVQSASLFLVL